MSLARNLKLSWSLKWTRTGLSVPRARICWVSGCLRLESRNPAFPNQADAPRSVGRTLYNGDGVPRVVQGPSCLDGQMRGTCFPEPLVEPKWTAKDWSFQPTPGPAEPTSFTSLNKISPWPFQAGSKGRVSTRGGCLQLLRASLALLGVSSLPPHGSGVGCYSP